MAYEIRALGPAEWQQRLDEARATGGAVRFGSGWDGIDLDDPNLPAHIRAMAEAIPGDSSSAEPIPVAEPGPTAAPSRSWWGRLTRRNE